MEMYDLVIIGGGIAGLSIAHKLAKQYPEKHIIVLEKYKVLGGRAATYKKDGLQYEIGAGRIWAKHERMNALVKKYGLTTFPIGTKSNFEDGPNNFTSLFYPISRELRKLPAETLRMNTIQDLLPPEYAQMMLMYPYRAEIDLLRSDIALPLFEPTSLMGSQGDNDYYGLKEGFSALVDALTTDVSGAGVEIRTGAEVKDVLRRSEDLFEITGSDSDFETIEAKQVIIATCRCSLSNFSVLSGLPLLTQLQTSALCRIYAVFPLVDGVAWFHDIPKTVTAGVLRYVIPINAKSGLIMISYTDGKDVEFWKEKDGVELEKAILDAAKELFPDKNIPAPTFLKKHVWPSGCTYWVPGAYDVEEAQRNAMNPSPNLYIVGESVAIHQEWMESALETVDLLEIEE